MSNLKNKMQDIAKTVESQLPPSYGFIVLTYPHNETGELLYVSNSNRNDVVRAMKEFIKKTENNMSEKSGFTQEEIIKIAAKAGADAAIAKIELARGKESKEWHDRRLRNADLLILNYRDFKECAANAIYDAEQSDEVVNILDLMWDPHYRSEQIIESIKSTAIRTKIIVTHIEGMISVYRTISFGAKNPVEKRRYETLYDYYIADVPLSISEIAIKQDVVPRTVYDDLKAASKRMATLLFGVDAILRNG